MDEFNFQDFATRVEQTATSLINGQSASDDLIQCARAVQEVAEVVLARNRGDRSFIACAPGCGHCCVVNVSVLTPEALTIVDYLQRHFSGEELVRFRRRLELLARKVDTCGDEERLRMAEPCVFLDVRHCCSIYLVRPLLCRGMNSTDPNLCRQAVSPEPGELAPPVMSNLFQIQLMEQAFIGLANALDQAGIDSRSSELSVAVQALLERQEDASA